MKTTYDPSLLMRAARQLYFAMNKFGDNGGYDDAWVNFKLGPVPFPFPNTKARIRAVQIHDLHHILTGYDTDIIGEFEISAWEIAAGCKDFYAAWVLNLGGVAAGLGIAPRRIAKAFARGLASRSLYGSDLDTLLALPVGEVRARFIDAGAATMPAKGWPLLGMAWLAGLLIGLPLFALLLFLVPIGLITHQLRKRELRTAGPSANPGTPA